VEQLYFLVLLFDEQPVQ